MGKTAVKSIFVLTAMFFASAPVSGVVGSVYVNFKLYLTGNVPVRANSARSG